MQQESNFTAILIFQARVFHCKYFQYLTLKIRIIEFNKIKIY